MGDLISLLGIIFGFLGGGSALMTWLLYRRQSERIKNAEAFEKEVSALRSEIEELRKSVEFERKQREQDKEIISKLEIINTQLHAESNTLEIKNARNKKAINSAYGCTFCHDSSNCPVLKQRQQNEDDYLRELQGKKR